jgi:hypothetical protein
MLRESDIERFLSFASRDLVTTIHSVRRFAFYININIAKSIVPYIFFFLLFFPIHLLDLNNLRTTNETRDCFSYRDCRDLSNRSRKNYVIKVNAATERYLIAASRACLGELKY